MLDSLIGLFHKFSEELILFEGMAIFILLALYTAFWVIRKRRLGSLDAVVPSSVVRTYLNELIQQAMLLRQQFFGLLAEAGMQIPPGMQVPGEPAVFPTQAPPADGAAAPAPDPAQMAAAMQNIAADPNLNSKMNDLQTQLNAQNQALSTVMQEKAKLEEELKAAKAGGGGGGGDGGEPGEDLRGKVKELEGKLAEYSVIEDDLANLKRLQQENEKLRASLESAGGAPPPAEEPAPAAAAPEPPKEAAAPAPEPPKEEEKQFEDLAKKTEESLKAEPEAPKEEAAPAPAPEPPKEEAKPAEPEPPKEEAKPAEPEPAAEAPPEEKKEEAKAEEKKAPVDDMGKSDEDLLSEFEKMLNM